MNSKKDIIKSYYRAHTKDELIEDILKLKAEIKENDKWRRKMMEKYEKMLMEKS